MISFLELVIAPAVLPWLIVLITDYVETRMDREEAAHRHHSINPPAADGHSI